MTRHNRYKVSDEVLLKSTSSIIGVASLAVAVTVGLIPSGHYDNDAHATNSHPSLCDIGWTQEPGVDIEQAARDCVADRTGKVALVGYQIDMPYLQDIAREAEAEISDGTNGLVRPEIIPLLASPEAVHQLNEANKSCQPDVIERNGASIADATMDLDSYAHVVSLVGTTRCDGATIGLAHSPKNGRYADIELKKSSLYPKPREDGPDDFVSHELGHAYGLEHSGYLSTTKYGFESRFCQFKADGQYINFGHEYLRYISSRGSADGQGVPRIRRQVKHHGQPCGQNVRERRPAVAVAVARTSAWHSAGQAADIELVDGHA
jgi:hypothetical protein